MQCAERDTLQCWIVVEFEFRAAKLSTWRPASSTQPISSLLAKHIARLNLLHTAWALRSCCLYHHECVEAVCTAPAGRLGAAYTGCRPS